MGAAAIDTTILHQVAALSRVDLPSGEEHARAALLSGILEAFRAVRVVDVAGAGEPLPSQGREHLREDRVDGATGQMVAMRNAPAVHRGHFRVPAVLEG